MKYRDLPRCTFRKGVSRRQRKLIKTMVQLSWRKYGSQIRDTSERACMDHILFGESCILVAWNSDTDEPLLQNLTPWKIPNE